MNSVTMVVVGNSAGYLVMPRPSRDDVSFPIVARSELADDGVDLTVINNCANYCYSPQVAANLHELVIRFDPDIVVFSLGLGEALPRILPRALMHWMYLRGDRGPTAFHRVSKFVRERIHRAYTSLGPTISKRFAGVLPSTVTPSRFEREMRFVISDIKTRCKSRIVLVECGIPGHRLTTRLHGSATRADAYNAILHRLAASYDDVTVLPLRDLLRTHGHEAMMGDSLHLSPVGHRLVGQSLASIVLGGDR